MKKMDIFSLWFLGGMVGIIGLTVILLGTIQMYIEDSGIKGVIKKLEKQHMQVENVKDGLTLYYGENTLYYVRDVNKISSPWFFLHIYPESITQLSDEDKENGFINEDFLIDDREISADTNTQIAQIEIPEDWGPYEKVETGQTDGDSQLWNYIFDIN